jgi:alpha-beta hydrolase superfamily lysophospholipase
MPILRCHTRLAYGKLPRQRLDVFAPEEHCDRPLVVLLHGLWWQQGRREELRPLALRLAEAGFACATLGYRGLGEDGANADGMLDDITAGVRFALEEHLLLGGDERSVVLVAGGGAVLPALILANRWNREDTYALRGLIACGGVPRCLPWPLCKPESARRLAEFAAGAADRLDPLGQEARHHPALLVLHGENDDQVPASAWRPLIDAIINADGEAQLTALAGFGHEVLDEAIAKSEGSVVLERILLFLKTAAAEDAGS